MITLQRELIAVPIIVPSLQSHSRPIPKKIQNNSLFLPFHKQVVKVVYRSVHSPLFTNVHKFLQQILHNPREQGVLLYNTTLLHSHTLYFKGFKGIKVKYKIYKFCTKGFS